MPGTVTLFVRAIDINGDIVHYKGEDVVVDTFDKFMQDFCMRWWDGSSQPHPFYLEIVGDYLGTRLPLVLCSPYDSWENYEL